MLDVVVGDQLEGRLVAHHGAVKEGQNDLSRTRTGALRRLVHMLIVSELGPTDLLAYIAASGGSAQRAQLSRIPTWARGGPPNGTVDTSYSRSKAAARSEHRDRRP
jgi:hypothetical protein